MLVKGQAARANMQLDDNYREWPILAALAIHSARTTVKRPQACAAATSVFAKEPQNCPQIGG
jgi:hypothetical protein